MKTNVKQMVFELPIEKTLQKQILSDKRRAFAKGDTLEIRYERYG